MIPRSIASEILDSLQFFPVVGIIGPRQVGKTTLVKGLQPQIAKPTVYLDLELGSDYNKLQDAETYLSRFSDHCVIIDEVQLRPDLFALLRALVDQKRVPARFILLGSASPYVVKQVTETLAGRIAYHELSPLSSLEVTNKAEQEDLWFRGGFPDALLAPRLKDTQRWLNNFIDTFIQRDLSQLGYALPETKMVQIVSMLAHLNGRLLNQSDLGRSLGVTHTTINKYLTILEGSFLIRLLPPFHENLKKRLVKSPKVYFRDTGVLHHLLRIRSLDQLMGHPALGTSWELFVIEQIIREAPEFSEFYFFQTSAGAEIDLVFIRPDGQRWAIEIKYSNSPKVTRGFYTAIEDIKADRAFVITPSSDSYPLNRAEVMGLETFLYSFFKSPSDF
ncbi:MAG: ATP-binding protein [Bacteroidota bacterium]